MMTRRNPKNSGADKDWSEHLGATIKDHWIVVLAGIITTCCATTAGVVGYISRNAYEASLTVKQAEFDGKVRDERESLADKRRRLDEEFQGKKKELEQRLSSLIMMVGDSDGLDVRKLIAEKGSELKALGGVVYSREGRFYAPQKDEYWTYEETDTKQLDEELYAKADNFVLQGVLENLRDVPNHKVYLWRASNSFDSKGDRILKQPFVHIAVQQASIEEARGRIADFWSSKGNRLILSMVLSVKDEDIQRLTNSLSAEDVVQLIYLFEFCKRQVIALQEPDLTYKTPKIQKIGDVFYAQFLGEFVGNQRFAIYEQLVIVVEGGRLFVIRTMTPTYEDDRGLPFDKTNEWLSRFRIANR